MESSEMNEAPNVAVLFARGDSFYKTIPGCDVYDVKRDARNYSGEWPVVAHPPCRAWAGLRHMATLVRPDEKDLARFAVDVVRKNGGVLEHPIRSVLWEDQGLPEQNKRDDFGGFTLYLPQFWFGHQAEKKSKFYVCGCEPRDVPEIPFILGDAPKVVGQNSGSRKFRHPDLPRLRPEIKKAEREHTPPRLALWLVELARKCHGISRAQSRS
jgi:hypothetical protein